MFKVSQTDGSLKGFLNLFAVHPFSERGIAFYRPVFREALHNIYFNIFGLNHIPFRALLLSIHFVNIWLVYLLIKEILGKKLVAFLTALFFGISSANVSTLYYLAGGIEASGGTLFALLTILFYKKYIDTSRLKFKIISLLAFPAALSSHEIILSVPLILVGLILISYPKKNIAHQILNLWPFFLLLSILLYTDLFKIGFSPGEAQYQFIWNIKTFFQSFIWYLLWAFGIPEMLIDFVLPGIKLHSSLMQYWGTFYKIIFPAFFVSVSLLLFFVFYSLLKTKSIFSDKKFLFLLFWFPIGLIPVIFLPAHKSSHYLLFVLTPFWGSIITTVLNFYSDFKKRNKNLAVSFLTIFLVSALLLNFASIKLGHKTYWAANRGMLAQKLINQVKSTFPALPKGSALYFTNDPNYPYLTKEWGGTSKQASIVLNGSDAIQLIYKDPSLQVFYEDLGGIPKIFPKDKVYTLVATINTIKDK